MTGSELLDEVAKFLKRFVIFQQPEAADFLALWVMHTHAFEASITTPYARITSPERESGKTRTFEVLAVLVRRPWLNAVVSTAILYRKGDRESPTLLLDEVDNIDFASRNELLGVLNSGYRLGIKVSRCDDKGEYRDFDPFFPKAFAGIAGGKLPDTLHSRSVVVKLQRRKKEETVERFFHFQADHEAMPLREALDAWAMAHLDRLAASAPDMPDELGDRAQEVWLPLLAIADAAGADWPLRARKAARALSGPSAAEQEEESRGVQLLGHIYEIFEGEPEQTSMTGEEGLISIATARLVERLNKGEEWPWAEQRDGKGLRGRDLATLLLPYAIRPQQVWTEGKNLRGYTREQFENVWARYLPETARGASPLGTPQPRGFEDPSIDGSPSGLADLSDDLGLLERDDFGPPGYNDDGEEMAF